jgi:surface carbohydrate biosynthesis protein
MKKNIYIAIEVKQREYLSNVLLASKAAIKGYRIYIGSQLQIFNLLQKKKNNGGIFLYKGGIDPEVFNRIKNKVDYNLFLDHEVAPGHNIKIYQEEILGHFCPQTLKNVDGYFCANSRIFSVARQVFKKKIKGNIFLTGWPRFDLFKKKYENIYRDRIDKIKKKYGSFILFSSDFTYISDNFKNVANEYSLWGYSRNFQKRNFEQIKLAEFNNKDFYKTIDFLNMISKKVKNYKIVVRAHPSENIKIWKKNLCKNIIFKEPNDDIHAWIAASKGLLQRGCTTSMQAGFLKKKIGYIDLIKNNRFKKKFIEKISFKIKSEKNFHQWLKIKRDNRNFKSIKKELGISKIDSCDKILKIFDKYHINTEDKISLLRKNPNKKITLMFNFFKRAIFLFLTKYTLINKNTDKLYITPKLFGGITSNETNAFLKKINKNIKCKSYQLDNDLIVIES